MLSVSQRQSTSTFRIFNKPVRIGANSPIRKAISYVDSLTLPSRHNVFSFEFAARSNANPQKNRYRYQLEGFEPGWNEVDSKHRQATYTNLDPGKYIFRVQGSNSDGVWNAKGVSLPVVITPPWWGTLWFRITSFVVIVASIWAGYSLRVHAVQRRNRELVKHNLDMQESQSALQKSEEMQRRLNRELRALSTCNEALIRATDEQMLLNEICRIVCEDAGYCTVWVGYVEHNEGKSIRPVAWSGVDEGHVTEISLNSANPEHGSGPGSTRSPTQTGKFYGESGYRSWLCCLARGSGATRLSLCHCASFKERQARCVRCGHNLLSRIYVVHSRGD